MPKPVITDPGDDLMRKMMSVTLGEVVAPEYAPLIREEMGLIARDARWSAEPPPSEQLRERHVLIVGAGVCAIALGVALGRLGIPYTIVEKNAEMGGTWYVNRYPGCGVDTPNHSYSFSFGPRNRWTRYFSPQQEISGLSEEDRRGVRRSRQYPAQYRLTVVAMGRQPAALDIDAANA